MCETEHKLQSSWKFWVVQSNRNYEIEPIASFSTIEEFWDIYSQFPNIEKMSQGGLSLFKEGIKPAWEDKKNENGFSVRIIKSFDKKSFDNLIMLIIGGTLEHVITDVNFCGLYVLKKQINIWNIALWFESGQISENSIKLLADLLNIEKSLLSIKKHNT